MKTQVIPKEMLHAAQDKKCVQFYFCFFPPSFNTFPSTQLLLNAPVNNSLSFPEDIKTNHEDIGYFRNSSSLQIY